MAQLHIYPEGIETVPEEILKSKTPFLTVLKHVIAKTSLFRHIKSTGTY